MATINSYLGFMKAHQTYAIRRNLLNSLSPLWYDKLYIEGHHEKVVLKKEFIREYIVKQKLQKKWKQKQKESIKKSEK